MKLPTFLASSSLLAVAACSGGGSSVDLDAKFSTTDDAHLVRALSAASGVDYGMAFFLGAAYGDAPADPTACPRVEVDGNVRSIVGGGCANADGTRYQGSIRLTNVPGLFGGDAGFDPGKPETLEFDAFSIDDMNDPIELDGSVSFDPVQGLVTTDLSVTIAGIAARSVLSLHSSGDGPVTAQDGSMIDVDGIGGAAVEGTWKFESQDDQGNTVPPSGSLTLRGAETLVFDIGGDVGGCFPYTIDGRGAGPLCGE